MSEHDSTEAALGADIEVRSFKIRGTRVHGHAPGNHGSDPERGWSIYSPLTEDGRDARIEHAPTLAGAIEIARRRGAEDAPIFAEHMRGWSLLVPEYIPPPPADGGRGTTAETSLSWPHPSGTPVFALVGEAEECITTTGPVRTIRINQLKRAVVPLDDGNLHFVSALRLDPTGIPARREDEATVSAAWPHPAGTPVIARLSEGGDFVTTTRTSAAILDDGRRVVLVDGSAGFWDVSHLMVLRTEHLNSNNSEAMGPKGAPEPSAPAPSPDPPCVRCGKRPGGCGDSEVCCNCMGEMLYDTTAELLKAKSLAGRQAAYIEQLRTALVPFAAQAPRAFPDPHPCLERCWRIGQPADVEDGNCIECGLRKPDDAEKTRIACAISELRAANMVLLIDPTASPEVQLEVALRTAQETLGIESELTAIRAALTGKQ